MKKKIVFLIESYVPHQMTTIQSLIEGYNTEIHSFSVSKTFIYIPSGIDNLYTYKLGDFSKQELLEKVLELKPDAIVTAGWMNPKSVWVAKKIKKRYKIPIVAYSDTPWYGTFRQKVNTLISPFHLREAFTHIWVAGIYQYDYARRLGFANDQIIFNSLSANIDLFNKIDICEKEISYPKNFLYIGRMTDVKGLDVLQKAWNNIKNKKGWTLTLVGDGELKKDLIKDSSFIIKDYMNQAELIDELENAGCFILPSRRETWSLVIHEAAAGGLPIICTKTCGAAPHFVIDGYNGYKVETNSSEALEKAMLDIMSLNTETLVKYSNNSRHLSTSITPRITAASLMQIIL